MTQASELCLTLRNQVYTTDVKKLLTKDVNIHKTMNLMLQWCIQGRTLVLDQKICRPPPPPYLRVWITAPRPPPPPLYVQVWIQH